MEYVIALFILFVLISLCIPVLAVVLNFWCWLFQKSVDVIENFSLKSLVVNLMAWYTMRNN